MTLLAPLLSLLLLARLDDQVCAHTNAGSAGYARLAGGRVEGRHRPVDAVQRQLVTYT